MTQLEIILHNLSILFVTSCFTIVICGSFNPATVIVENKDAATSMPKIYKWLKDIKCLYEFCILMMHYFELYHLYLLPFSLIFASHRSFFFLSFALSAAPSSSPLGLTPSYQEILFEVPKSVTLTCAGKTKYNTLNLFILEYPQYKTEQPCMHSVQNSRITYVSNWFNGLTCYFHANLSFSHQVRSGAGMTRRNHLTEA